MSATFSLSLLFSVVFAKVQCRSMNELTDIGPCTYSSLVGGPIGGSLVAHYGYLGLSTFTGASMVAGSLLVAGARFAYSRDAFVAV